MARHVTRTGVVYPVITLIEAGHQLNYIALSANLGVFLAQDKSSVRSGLADIDNLHLLSPDSQSKPLELAAPAPEKNILCRYQVLYGKVLIIVLLTVYCLSPATKLLRASRDQERAAWADTTWFLSGWIKSCIQGTRRTSSYPLW